MPLASIITLFCGNEAVYLYGASSNEKRNLMPAYSLQWRAINDAIAFGCDRYDFYGIPPTNDESHPMHGLYRFKTGFGGSIVHRVGSYDIVLRPVLYFGYRFAEGARSFWFKKIVKILRKETLRKS
jgi:lipid II:glycine glycyltransferase (peptidoglycan interpeptide bridge formation enzyme)